VYNYTCRNLSRLSGGGEEEQRSVFLRYPVERTGLRAAPRGNLAASLPQADKTFWIVFEQVL